MPKRPKMCRSSSSSFLSHFLFPRDFSGTIADRDINNTCLLYTSDAADEEEEEEERHIFGVFGIAVKWP